MIEPLFIGCDNGIIRDGVIDEFTGLFLNPTDDSATCVFTLCDEDKVAVSVTYTDITMDYEADSDGRWKGTLDEEAPLVEGTIYFIKITVTASSDRKDTVWLKRIGTYKGGD